MGGREREETSGGSAARLRSRVSRNGILSFALCVLHRDRKWRRQRRITTSLGGKIRGGGGGAMEAPRDGADYSHTPSVPPSDTHAAINHCGALLSNAAHNSCGAFVILSPRLSARVPARAARSPTRPLARRSFIKVLHMNMY